MDLRVSVELQTRLLASQLQLTFRGVLFAVVLGHQLHAFLATLVRVIATVVLHLHFCYLNLIIRLV